MSAELFRLVQVVVLSAALPAAVIAAWGYRNAPFGKALWPLVPIAVAYLSLSLLELYQPPWAATAAQVVGSIGLVFIAWATLQMVLLLSGRRPV